MLKAQPGAGQAVWRPEADRSGLALPYLIDDSAMNGHHASLLISKHYLL